MSVCCKSMWLIRVCETCLRTERDSRSLQSRTAKRWRRVCDSVCLWFEEREKEWEKSSDDDEKLSSSSSSLTTTRRETGMLYAAAIHFSCSSSVCALHVRGSFSLSLLFTLSGALIRASIKRKTPLEHFTLTHIHCVELETMPATTPPTVKCSRTFTHSHTHYTLETHLQKDPSDHRHEIQMREKRERERGE